MQTVDYFAAIRLVEVIAGVLVYLGFVAIYHRKTHGDWRRNEHGVHLMLFTGAIGLILAYVLSTIVGLVPPSSWPYASTVIFAIILALGVWRLVLLLRAQRRS